MTGRMVLFFREITKEDVPIVGGKAANLGEMYNKTQVPIPPGFAVTANAFWHFINENKLGDRIAHELHRIVNANDTKALEKIGANIRAMILKARIPEDLRKNIELAYEKMGEPLVAARSSATAEDLPGASFAGAQETYLNLKGKRQLIEGVKKCYASLYTGRAIFYRIQQGFEHKRVALSVAVQKMVDSIASGVVFTLDVRDGNRDLITIEGSYGLGEYVVKGIVTPDTYFVRKKGLKIAERKIAKKEIMLKTKKGGGTIETKVPSHLKEKPVLTNNEIELLARYSLQVETHYKIPQDLEWAKDLDNTIYIVQSRPETAWVLKKVGQVFAKSKGKELLKGLSASPGLGSGPVKIIRNLSEVDKINDGDILVTRMTNPDMVPAMKKAVAIVTDEGGATSHAAIVSRELGIPCVVGTEKATKILKDGMGVTIDGSRGIVFAGLTAVSKEVEEAKKLPKTRTKIYVNVGIPELADKIAQKPVDGVGLMREEFIIATYIKEHPLHMLEEGRGNVFVNKLAEAVEKVTKAFYPRPVVLRFSDFKTNEYRELKGGAKFEPKEENPMIGWRGSSRYISPKYEKAFLLELRAVKKVRKKYKNLWLMLPMARTVEEVRQIEKIMKKEGLVRGKDLKLWLMAEVPSNIFLTDQFSKYCDGFSIGSNDLTQLVLGVDRDSQILGRMGLYNENNEAVKRAIEMLIKTAHKCKKTVSICGQAPSVYPDFAVFLVKAGIDSISINPDVVEKTIRIVAEAEKKS